MNRMAIFAEGRTEVEFDSKLIQEIASLKAITIQSTKIRGGSTVPRRSEIISLYHSDGAGDLTTHQFLLVDCGSEDLAKSRMREEYDNLTKAGYSEILCHRDVAPNVTRMDIRRLEMGLPKFIKTDPIQVKYILSVMEVEAWFLAEHSHFPKIDPQLSLGKISQAFGFDPSTDDMQKRDSPAADLHNCYDLVGKAYTKFTSQTTIDALDYVGVYAEIASKFPYLKKLCDAIDDFLDR